MPIYALQMQLAYEKKKKIRFAIYIDVVVLINIYMIFTEAHTYLWHLSGIGTLAKTFVLFNITCWKQFVLDLRLLLPSGCRSQPTCWRLVRILTTLSLAERRKAHYGAGVSSFAKIHTHAHAHNLCLLVCSSPPSKHTHTHAHAHRFIVAATTCVPLRQIGIRPYSVWYSFPSLGLNP